MERPEASERLVAQDGTGDEFRPCQTTVKPMRRYREHEVLPGSFEVEFEQVAAVGQKHVAASQACLLTALDDPGFAREVHAGNMEVAFRQRDLATPMHSAKSVARHDRDRQS